MQWEGGAYDARQLDGGGRNERGGGDDVRQPGGGGRNERGGWMMQGNQVVDDMKRGEGRTPRTQCSGGRHNKRGVGQCEARSLR